jgi:hypothetical protein
VPVFAEGRRLAFLRHLEGERLLVLLNAGDEPGISTSRLELLQRGTVFEDLLGGQGAVIEEGHLRKVHLPAWQGASSNPRLEALIGKLKTPPGEFIHRGFLFAAQGWPIGGHPYG